MIGHVKNSDLVFLLQNLHADLGFKNVGSGLRPTLVMGIGKGHATQRNFASLLEDFRSLALQDWVGVIANKRPDVHGAVGRSRHVDNGTGA